MIDIKETEKAAIRIKRLAQALSTEMIAARKYGLNPELEVKSLSGLKFLHVNLKPEFKRIQGKIEDEYNANLVTIGKLYVELPSGKEKDLSVAEIIDESSNTVDGETWVHGFRQFNNPFAKGKL